MDWEYSYIKRHKQRLIRIKDLTIKREKIMEELREIRKEIVADDKTLMAREDV